MDEVSTFNNENLFQSLFLFAIIVITLIGAAYLISRSNKMKFIAIEEAKHLREKRELEIKLGESESHYKTIVENSPNPIFIHCEGEIVYVNPAGISTYGVKDAGFILGKSVFDLVYPEDRKLVKQRVTDMILSGVPASIIEERFITFDERVIYAEVTPVPLVFQNKKAILVIVNDITDRKRLELERQTIYDITLGVLTASNLNDLLKFIHQSLMKVLYGDNCFVALYDQTTDLFSFPYFVDKYDPIPEPLALKKSCTAYVFRTGKPLLLTPELFQQLKESDEVELVGSPSPSWVGIPLQTKDKIIGVLVLQHYEDKNAYSERDVKFLSTIGNEIAVVVERKLAEEDRIRVGQEIKKRSEELARINIVKDKFFSIIAHDLKSPFNGFIGMTGIIAKEDEGYSREELINYNKIIHESATNLYKLIENLLEWAQMQKGSIRFVPDNYCLSDIATQNIALINDKALQKGVAILNDIQGDFIVYADRKMLDTILRNLLSNAVKFTRRNGKVIVSAKCTEDKMIEVSVKDTGVGISEANVKRLFRMEEKVSSQGTEGESSTGLGLLLCKEFVEKHKGMIHAESNEGRGSQFYFTLPIGNIPLL
jgi:PAS domain S-box-containing protein